MEERIEEIKYWINEHKYDDHVNSLLGQMGIDDLAQFIYMCEQESEPNNESKNG